MRIACAANVPEDPPQVAAKVVETAQAEVVLLSYHAPRLLGELAQQSRHSAGASYGSTLADVLSSISASLFLNPECRLLTNAGGLDPVGCAASAAKVLVERGCESHRIAVVRGDDLMERLEELLHAGVTLDHRDTDERFVELKVAPQFAVAWLDASGIAVALEDGAQMVIAGSVGASSLSVGAARFFHRWSADEYRRIAGVAAVGHCFAGEEVATCGTVADVAADGRVQVFSTAACDSPLSHDAWQNSLAGCRATPDVEIDRRQVPVVTSRGHTPEVFDVAAVSGLAPGDALNVSIGVPAGFEAFGLCVLGELGPEGLMTRLHRRVEQCGHQLGSLTCEPFSAGLFVIHGTSEQFPPVDRLARELRRMTRDATFPQDLEKLLATEVQPRLREWPAEVPRELIQASADCRAARDWL